jgi:RNA 2',3'-cyclic 3'-phosphodiesterase
MFCGRILMRLFTAIDLPEHVKKQVENVCDGLREVRWVKPHQLHLTLRFIGEVDKSQFDKIKDALGQVNFGSLELRLQGVGQFPPKKTPRILWVGVSKPDALVQLAKRVEKIIVELGYPPEEKAFSPHITLARLKFPPSGLENFYAKNAYFRSDPFTVSQFVLYSSSLQPGGSVYRQEAVYGATL